MLINENKEQYKSILKIIATNVSNQKLENLIKGRRIVVQEWVKAINKGVKTLGPKSTVIIEKDVNIILNKVMGYDY